MQHVPHAHAGRVGEQHKAQVRRRLVKVQLVLGGPVRDEGVVVPAELTHHVAQREDGSKDELGVVLAAVAPRLARVRRTRRWGKPLLGVDAFGCFIGSVSKTKKKRKKTREESSYVLCLSKM